MSELSENQSLTANSASEQQTAIHQQMDNEIENDDKLLESESVDTSQTAQDQAQALKPDSTKSEKFKNICDIIADFNTQFNWFWALEKLSASTN